MTCAVILLSVSAWPSQAFTQPDGAAARYTQSYELESRGDYAGALEVLEGMPDARRTTYTFLLRKGWLLYLGGQHAASATSYRRAVEAQPLAVEPLIGLMLPLSAARRWSEAVEVGRRALKIDAENYLASSRLAWALYNLGRYGEAERYYRRMVVLYPSDLEMLSGLAWSLLKQGEPSEAIALFEQVLDISPNHVGALRGLREAR